jgi:predicted nucleic acid-binding protein
MTFSSSPALTLERGLDTMILVYYLLQGHPAALPCEQFLRAHSGWFTSPLVLIEAKNILTKVYNVNASDVSTKLLQFAAGPIVLLDLDEVAVTSSFQLADASGLDLTDAVLLHLAQRYGATYLATEDQRLAGSCTQFGITPQSPFDAVLRKQVASWEASNLAPKGLSRVLRRVHDWLSQPYPQAAQDFWTQTGGGSHLP